MRIHDIHPLHVEAETFEELQSYYATKIKLETRTTDKAITSCAGVDVAYWKQGDVEYGVCSIVVMEVETKTVIEKVQSSALITVPYIPGYLAFRELPLIIDAARKLVVSPDLFIFDGNGYLHPRHMGIATHASFFLDKPTIGVAKNYFKLNGLEYPNPQNEIGAFETIIIDDVVVGRVLRTRKNVKPVFISCGNYIDLETTTEIIQSLLTDESRLPIPVRLADLESKRLRRECVAKL